MLYIPEDVNSSLPVVSRTSLIRSLCVCLKLGNADIDVHVTMISASLDSSLLDKLGFDVKYGMFLRDVYLSQAIGRHRDYDLIDGYRRP